ncbi:MAG: WhiB family transcriptional regulator [Acidimicrobiia bacterium]
MTTSTAAPPTRRRRRSLIPIAARPDWFTRAACTGRSYFFFADVNERPPVREYRERCAREICARCPVLEECRSWARTNREYGYWGGENEADRIRAGHGPPRPALGSDLGGLAAPPRRLARTATS